MDFKPVLTQRRQAFLRPPSPSPAWQLLLASLATEPDIERLTTLAAAPPDWDELHAICKQHGTFPLVYQALDRLPSGVMPTTAREKIRSAAAACMVRSLAMRGELERLLNLLAGAGIPARPFKGPVLAEKAYGDVALRVFDDLDLLVPQKDVRRVVAVMEGEGYVLDIDRQLLECEKFYSLTQHVGLTPAAKPWLVEVHWALFNEWRGIPLSLDDAGKSSAGSLADEDLLLYLCVHGMVHWWNKLKWVVDLDRLVRSAPGLDWERVYAQAKALGCRRAVSLGLRLAQSCLGTPLPEICKVQSAGDKSLDRLEAYAIGNWFEPCNFEGSRWQRYWFTLTSRERLGDRLLMLPGNLWMRFGRWRLGMPV